MEQNNSFTPARIQEMKNTVERGRSALSRGQGRYETLVSQQAEIEAEMRELGINSIEELNAKIQELETQRQNALAEADRLIPYDVINTLGQNTSTQ